MRVVICWSGISGYLVACWRALAGRPDIQLKVITTFLSSPAAPFDRSIVTGLESELLSQSQITDARHVADSVVAHRPDLVVICGWFIRAYGRLPYDGRLAGAKFVMGMDNPWADNWRQRLAPFKVGRLLKRMAAVIVAGERSWQFAHHLGVPEQNILRGVYAVDEDQLAPLYARRVTENPAWPKRFLFIGRYEDAKGVDVLIKAYCRYRDQHTDAWPLTCCGAGPMGVLLNEKNVENLGFVQPPAMPAVWVRSGVFILASRSDPWGVVIPEAAAAGLPVICTEACGASVEVVRSYFNGLTVATNAVEPLARAMGWMHNHYDTLPEMGRRGIQLAAPFSNHLWAMRWHELFSSILN